MHGFSVRLAANGEEAIEMINQAAPDLLLLDLRMPKVDGFQVLQKFPKAERTFPIIALTNFHDTDSKIRSLELGADEYCTKNETTLRILLDIVNKHLKA